MNPTSYIQKDARVIVVACVRAIKDAEDRFEKDLEEAIQKASVKKRMFRKPLHLTREEALEAVHHSIDHPLSRSTYWWLEYRRDCKVERYSELKRLAEASSGTVWLCKEDNERLDRYY